MKRLLFATIATLLVATSYAQEVIEKPFSDYEKIEVSGNIRLTLAVATTEQPPMVCYKLNDGAPEKFVVEVRDGALLYIAERLDKNRKQPTEVTIYYPPTLRSLSALYADVSFAEPINSLLVLDITLASGAKMAACELDLLDLKLKVSGKSEANVSGKLKYLTIEAVNSAVDATSLDVMSVVVSASQRATVDVVATDRVDVSCSSNAVVSYGGDPNIIRESNTTLLGGEIRDVRAE